MSNASLKEQLQAVASQLSSDLEEPQKPKKKLPYYEKKLKIEEKLKKVKPKWLDYVQYGVELLKVYFPSSFKPMNEVKPLKKGIKQDLVKRLSTMGSIMIEDKACMLKSLSFYVNTVAYHKNIVEGSIRIDLDGNPAGVVSCEEAKYSIERNQAKLLTKKHLFKEQITESKNKINVNAKT